MGGKQGLDRLAVVAEAGGQAVEAGAGEGLVAALVARDQAVVRKAQGVRQPLRGPAARPAQGEQGDGFRRAFLLGRQGDPPLPEDGYRGTRFRDTQPREDPEKSREPGTRYRVDLS